MQTSSLFGRRSPVAALLLAVLLLPGLAGDPAPRPDSAAAATTRIMPLGDSITDGWNVAGGYRISLFSRLTQANYGFDFVGSMDNGPQADTDHEATAATGSPSSVRTSALGWRRIRLTSSCS